MLERKISSTLMVFNELSFCAMFVLYSCCTSETDAFAKDFTSNGVHVSFPDQLRDDAVRRQLFEPVHATSHETSPEFPSEEYIGSAIHVSQGIRTVSASGTRADSELESIRAASSAEFLGPVGVPAKGTVTAKFPACQGEASTATVKHAVTEEHTHADSCSVSTNPLPRQLVLLTGVPGTTRILLTYFRNQKHSGGGEVEIVEEFTPHGCVLLRFKDPNGKDLITEVDEAWNCCNSMLVKCIHIHIHVHSDYVL